MDPEDWLAMGDLLDLDLEASLREARGDFTRYRQLANAAAQEQGCDERFFEVPEDSQNCTVVALDPEHAAALATSGHLLLRPARWTPPPPILDGARAHGREPPWNWAVPHDAIAGSRRVFHAVCAGRGVHAEVVAGPPDRFVATFRRDEQTSSVAFVMNEVIRGSRRAFAFQLVDRGTESFAVIEDLVRELDDRMELEGCRFTTLAQLEEHLLVDHDDWTRGEAGLWLAHEDAGDEWIWLGTLDIAGEPWVDLTISVTDETFDPKVVLDSMTASPCVAQSAGKDLDLRAMLPLALVTGARIIEMADQLVWERRSLRDELGLGTDDDDGEEELVE
jgi:hypothetical protein